MRYRFKMEPFRELIAVIGSATRRWAKVAKKRVHEVGGASMRHLETQDLHAERKRAEAEVGRAVVTRFVAGKKTVRADSPEIAGLMARIGAVDARLQELEEAAEEGPQEGK